jgi:hypothetical protein
MYFMTSPGDGSRYPGVLLRPHLVMLVGSQMYSMTSPGDGSRYPDVLYDLTW